MVARVANFVSRLKRCCWCWLIKAECVKTGPGLNTCTCGAGWVGDGTYCYPSTPCLNNSHCHESAVCQSSEPGRVINSICFLTSPYSTFHMSYVRLKNCIYFAEYSYRLAAIIKKHKIVPSWTVKPIWS